MEHKKIRFVIDSDLANVLLVGMVINKLCSIFSFDGISNHDIELCVVEAVNNCIVHAYGNEKGHEVEVCFILDQNRLVLDICDTGKPMDQGHLEQEDGLMQEFDSKDLFNISEKGRGLSIMKKIMDSVVYTTKRGKNCLTLTKNIIDL